MHGGNSNNQSDWLRGFMLTAVWLGGAAIIFFTAWMQLPEVLVVPITLVILAVCWGATFGNQFRSTSRKTPITTFEGLRGSFVIHHPTWYLLALLGLIGVFITVILVAETGVGNIRFAQWIGLIILAGVGVLGPFNVLSKQVFAFRIDQEGTIWVRHWGRYQPLVFNQFREVRCITTTYKNNSFVPLHIVCSNGRGPLHQVVFSLSGIHSTSHRMPINGQLLEAYIYNACREADMHIEHVKRGQRRSWLATPQNSRSL